MKLFMSKKKVLQILWFWVVLVWVWYWGYHFFYANKTGNNLTTPQQDVYFEVWTGDVINSIKVLWETNLLNEQKLKFNLDGTVSKVNISEWKLVKSWEVLAELDSGELQNELKEAQINYDNAKINLNTQMEKLTGDDKIKDKTNLESSQRKITLAQYDFTQLKQDNTTKVTEKIKEIESSKLALEKLKKESQISKQNLTTDVKDKKEDLEYKKKTFDDKKWNFEKQILDEQRWLDTKLRDYDNTFSNTYETIANDISSFEDSLKNVNNLLGLDSEFKSVQLNIYFSAKNSTYRNLSETNYWEFKWKIKNLEKEYDKGDKNNLTVSYLTGLLNIEKDLYETIYNLWDALVKWADYSIETSDLSNGDISAIKSIWSTLRNSGHSSKASIDTTIEKLKNLDTPDELKEKSRIVVEELKKSLQDLDKDLVNLEKDFNNLYLVLPEKVKEIDLQIERDERNLLQAQKDLEDLKYRNKVSEEDKQIDIKTQKQDYEIAVKNFNKKYINIAESEEVKLLENTLKQAQIAIDQVNKKIENYILKAPFDGVVDSFSLKVWDNLSTNSSEEKYIHIVNPNMMEIKIKLDQIDIVKVKKGMEAQVNFDSYPEKIFTWTLDTIDSKPIDENGVKKYQVKMVIDKWDLNIFSWMSANVDIVFEKKEWVILVPTMAIELNNETGENYVTVLKDGKKEKQVVELGLNSNGNTEILSGLEVWQQVLEINFDANMFQIEDFSNGWGMMF